MYVCAHRRHLEEDHGIEGLFAEHPRVGVPETLGTLLHLNSCTSDAYTHDV